MEGTCGRSVEVLLSVQVEESIASSCLSKADVLIGRQVLI
jgi:hypothetical protein